MELKNHIDFPYDIVFDTPKRLTDIRSWHGHIPFAFFLVQALRPKVIVELGVHKGDSYCAFCQAVRKLKTECRCYGIDTWKGDPQAGFYGEEVLEELRQFHDELFGHFSTLIRSYFDDALAHFADRSIDLLHIDGCHDYETVKHDFESWLPKVNKGGIVLLHDTAEKGKGFGVWKLWEEVSAGYPGFEFHHSHGLGMLVVGREIPETLSPFFRGSERDKHLIRAFFSTLGDAILYRNLARELQDQVAYLGELAERHKEMIKERDRQIMRLQEYVGRLEHRERSRVGEGQ